MSYAALAKDWRWRLGTLGLLIFGGGLLFDAATGSPPLWFVGLYSLFIAASVCLLVWWAMSSRSHSE